MLMTLVIATVQLLLGRTNLQSLPGIGSVLRIGGILHTQGALRCERREGERLSPDLRNPGTRSRERLFEMAALRGTLLSNPTCGPAARTGSPADLGMRSRESTTRSHNR